MPKEYIDKETARRMLSENTHRFTVADEHGFTGTVKWSEKVIYAEVADNVIAALPAADVREVVLCGECYLHTHCRTEDVFDFAGLREENRFCSIGKRKTNSAKMEVQDG